MISKQTIDEPLFPEIEWEAPQNRKQRGELLIVGGSPHGFASVANSYEFTRDAGVGRARVLMPDATQHAVRDFLEEVSFLPSTPSGSFSKRGLTELKALAADSWATLFAGELGRNSETSALVEGFLMSTTGKVVLTKDAVEYATTSYPGPILKRKNTLLVASLSQLQKLFKNAGLHENLRFEMNIEQFASFFESLTAQYPLHIVTSHHKHIFTAVDGRVVLTPHSDDEGLWQTRVAAYSSVYWIQHEAKALEALATAVYEALQN